jgi:outer membrane protein
MKMVLNKKTFLVAVCFLFALNAAAQAADVAKIGVVDFQRFLTTSKAGKSAQEEFKSKGEKMEANLKKLEDEIKTLKERLEREAMVMSQQMREEKEREYRIKINDFKQQKQRFMTELKSLEGRLVTGIRDELLELIKEVGKKEGYLLIIDKAAVHYNPSAIDITDDLIKKYNEASQ